MTGDEANTWQAYSALAQAVSAIIALGVAVAVPYIQRRIDRKVRVEIEPVMVWELPTLRPGKLRIFISRNSDRYDDRRKSHGHATAGMEIFNHGTFPVTINEISLMQHSDRGRRSIITDATPLGPYPQFPLEIPAMGYKLVMFTQDIFNYSYSSKTLVRARTQTGLNFHKKATNWCFLNLARKKSTSEIGNAS